MYEQQHRQSLGHYTPTDVAPQRTGLSCKQYYKQFKRHVTRIPIWSPNYFKISNKFLSTPVFTCSVVVAHQQVKAEILILYHCRASNLLLYRLYILWTDIIKTLKRGSLPLL